MNDTKPGRDETGFCADDKFLKPALIIQAGQGLRHRATRPIRQGTVMIKAISAVAVAAFIAAALTVLPGFAPAVEASVPVALAKADRLDIKPVGRSCSEQAWPNFEANCLRNAEAKTLKIREARLVTAVRK